jgi:hypothetical protein
MGKKKSKKNKRSDASPSGSKRYTLPAVFGVVVLAIVAGGFWYNQPPVQPVAPATGTLVETRPVLTPALFSGKAKLAYQYAAEIPKIIDSQFCYCYCKRNHNHKTLLTCFTTMHGSKCDICMDEVIYAYELYQQGKTLDEIVVAVDKKFYRPYKRHL